MTIYDFGANNGDDLPYYLTKGERVVAVEANPVLCEQIVARFPNEIASGRLVVEAKVLAAEPSEDVFFYIHKTNHVLSQFPKPEAPEEFERVTLPSCSPVELIERYGPPLYVKIDIEHYDQVVLRSLFDGGVRPPFISAEAHSREVFDLLRGAGGYTAFKLVDGLTVPQVYPDFPPHAAGPFGDDVRGKWFSAQAFAKVLAIEGLGWKDIHASNCRKPHGVSIDEMMRRGLARVRKRISR